MSEKKPADRLKIDAPYEQAVDTFRRTRTPKKKTKPKKKPEKQDMVILKELPPGLLDELPKEDRAAITKIVGKRVALVGYKGGKVELEFIDRHGTIHFIFVDPDYIR